jgi:NADH-quinone oxidoreductase subunit G
LWTDRCIKCRRCTRFLDEVSGTGELCLVERGDHTEIDIAPGHPVDNPLMGNIVDLCPVGALIDKDLIHSYRAWYLRRVDSICPACSKGCNIQVQAHGEFVRRLVPRENRAVNAWWMCDRGRKDFPHIHSRERVLQARVDGQSRLVLLAAETAGQRLAEAASRHGPESVAGLASAWLTLEELHLFRWLFAEVLKARPVGLLVEPDGQERVFPKFRIEKDHNPNRAGAQVILGPQAEAEAAGILAAARAGRLKALYVASSMPHFAPPPELLAALEQIPLVIVQDLLQGALAEKAQILLPGSSFVEKDGVFVNVLRRAQVIRRAIDPVAQGLDDLAVLQQVARGAGAVVKAASARELFSELAARYPGLTGLSHQSLGRHGRDL